MIKSSRSYTRRPSSWHGCRRLQTPYLILLALVLVSWTTLVKSSVNFTEFAQNRTLECNLTGNITWWKNVTIQNQTSRSFIFKDIQRSNAGTYKCSNSTTNIVFIVTVQYPAAALNVSQSHVRKNYGEKANVYCDVEGEPLPNVSWYKDSKIVQQGNNLTFGNINCSQAGNYTCVPHNSLGANGNKTVSIQVTPAQPINATLKRSESATGLVASWTPTSNDGCQVTFRVELMNCSSNQTLQFYNTNGTNYTFKDLTLGSQYCMKIRVESTLSSINSDWQHAQYMPEASTKSTETTSATESTTAEVPTGSNGVVIGLAVTLPLVFVIFILVMAWWLRKRASNTLPCQGFFQIENPPSPEEAPSDKKGPIAIPRFKMHCAMLHADSDYRFSEEFKSCPAAKKVTWNNSDKPENQSKNRFSNVVAYDHSRVVLSLNDGDPESHYINANFVDGYGKPNAYIATQGPLPNTMNDFWKMVWEQNCHVIVMITNIIEKGRHKCAMYWPSKKEKMKDYGGLKVTLLGEEVFAHYTVRTLEVKPLDGSTHYTQFKFPSRSITIGANWDPTDDEIRPMLVTQYHYTGWPDHGAPENGLEYAATDFIHKSGTANTQAGGPIIVHCSAGVGRSGAYIVIQSMIQRLHQTRDLDIYGFLAQIRKQRNHLVQEQSQYIFVHDALLQYIENSLRLSIPMSKLKSHVQTLRTQTTNINKSKMADEYQKVAVITVKAYDLKEANKLCNQTKNRHPQYIPADSKRMKLYPRPREEGSDYINASYLDGFWRREAYIATQHPLGSTVKDFWRMVWQENSRSIVMLTSQEELEKDDYDQYVPSVSGSTTFGNYKVTTESEVIRGDTSFKQLTMCALNDPSNSRKLQHFHFMHWAEDSLPWSGQTVLQLISKVAEWESNVKENADPFEEIGPIVVHCNYGVGRTGVYCLLHTLYHQLHKEKSVSLQQNARMFNFQRPCCIRSQAQYEFCYDTLVEYIEADCSVYLV